MKNFFKPTKRKIFFTSLIFLASWVVRGGMPFMIINAPIEILLYKINLSNFPTFYTASVFYYYLIVCALFYLFVDNGTGIISNQNKTKKVSKILLAINILVNASVAYSLAITPKDFLSGFGQFLFLIVFIPLMLIIQGIYIYKTRPYRRNLTHYLTIILLLANLIVPWLIIQLILINS
jgi:hypothetical protein